MTTADEIYESPFTTGQIARYAVARAHRYITSEGTEDAAERYYASIEDADARRYAVSEALAAVGWTRSDLARALS